MEQGGDQAQKRVKRHWTLAGKTLEWSRFMKSNTITSVLNLVLAASLILSLFYCLQFISVSRQIRSYSGQVQYINSYRTGLQALINDCLAYGEKNPTIYPILKTVGVEPKAVAVPTKQPGTR